MARLAWYRVEAENAIGYITRYVVARTSEQAIERAKNGWKQFKAVIVYRENRSGSK